MSLADSVARFERDVPDVDVVGGVFVRSSGREAVVDVGAARLTIPTLGAYFPLPSDPVRILRVGEKFFLLGPAAPRASTGRVTAGGTPRCTVEYPSGSGVTQLMGYPVGTTPAVNDTVIIDWASGGNVIAILTTQTVIAPPENPQAGVGGQQTQVFTALDSGTVDVRYGSYFTNGEVWASVNTKSGWFYGSKIRDTIPDGAAIVKIEIYLPAISLLGAANLRVHTSASRPGGQVGFTGATHVLTRPSGWVELPTSFGDYLKANLGGVGFDGGGLNKYQAVGRDGQSGALRVTYNT